MIDLEPIKKRIAAAQNGDREPGSFSLWFHHLPELVKEIERLQEALRFERALCDEARELLVHREMARWNDMYHWIANQGVDDGKRTVYDAAAIGKWVSTCDARRKAEQESQWPTT
jgi:hypothetical protein